MHETDAKFELIYIAPVLAGEWIVGAVAGTEIARLGGTGATAREFKNIGNKAKKWLKTNDITVFNSANCARFARNLPRIEH